MELTKALNYMKTIIHHGMERKNSTINVRNGLKEYLGTLIKEGVISGEDAQILGGIVQRLDLIMKKEMTVDEAFVRSMCHEENTPYISDGEKKTTPAKKTTTRRKKTSKPKAVVSTSTEESVSKPIAERRSSNPWDNFPIEPDGSCGRIQEARRKAAYEEWLDSLSSHEDEIWPKCRH